MGITDETGKEMGRNAGCTWERVAMGRNGYERERIQLEVRKFQRIRMKIIDIITSRLLLIFPEISRKY